MVAGRLNGIHTACVHVRAAVVVHALACSARHDERHMCGFTVYLYQSADMRVLSPAVHVLPADAQQRLTLHIRDLGAREKAIHAQLAALSEEAGSDLL